MAHYKMGIYGEPAVGKSVFSLGWPNPFFICTDENYEYLKPFGAKEQNHIQVTSWEEFKNFVKTAKLDSFDTIVIDLIEDLYQWADAEYCRRNKIDDLGDLGYGKGYKIVRNDFTYYILKIINLKKNVILLSHQESSQDKNNRGIQYTSYSPSSYIPKKCWEMINGKLRFFFRAHMEEEQEGEEVVKKRLLSVRPKAHEFQINRGLNVDSLPDDIDLTYDAFVELFGKPSDIGEINIKSTENIVPDNPKEVSNVQSEQKDKVQEIKTKIQKKVIEEKPIETKTESIEEKPVTEEKSIETKTESVEEKPVKIPTPKQEEPVKKVEVKSGKEDYKSRIEAIKAKLAAQKQNK